LTVRSLWFKCLLFSLSGFLCIQTKREFNIRIPETVEVLTGSCLTIPCSFDIREEYDGNLNKDCEGKWVYPDTKTPKLKPVKEIGNLTEKNCTSTFLKMNYGHAGKSQFRLECDNRLKWTFTNPTVTVEVKGNPSALTVKEGTSVSLTCSAPASCPSHPPTLTWTPKLADSQETLKENQDQTKVQISVLNFTASHLHHGKTITCTAVYWKHGGSGVSVNSSFTADITYSPKDTRVSVSPSGPVPVHISVSLTCISDARPEVKNYSWYRADGEQETLIGHGRVLNITTSISYRDYFCKAENELGPGCSNITHINETAEDNIYASTSELGEEDAAEPLNDSQRTSDNFSSSASTEGLSVSPGNDQEDVTYASVTFKAKRNSKAGKKSGDFSVCEKSCQTEERFVVEDAGKNFVRNALEMGTVYAEVVTKKKVECEYASVNFKTKTNKTA
uniref:Ig-like domain-containing protein n=1 Tax=Oryzias melastigma TaxID=30732 RepID=A0A3B3CNK7_ORYME